MRKKRCTIPYRFSDLRPCLWLCPLCELLLQTSSERCGLQAATGRLHLSGLASLRCRRLQPNDQSTGVQMFSHRAMSTSAACRVQRWPPRSGKLPESCCTCHAGKPPTDRFHHFRIVDVRIFRGACLRAAAESKRVGPSSSNPLCASCVDHGYVVELYEMQ